MTKRLISILLDSFRWDYINEIDTPFLYNNIKKSVYTKQLLTTQGFTQRTVIYTGCDASKTNLYSAFYFDKKSSPFKKIRNDLNLINHVNWYPKIIQNFFKTRYLGKILNSLNYRLLDKKLSKITKYIDSNEQYAPTCNIPTSILCELGLAEDNKPIWKANGCVVESISDVLIRNKINYDYIMWPRTTDSSDENIHEKILSSRKKFITSQFSDCDTKVHEHGVDSIERRIIVSELDRKLREIFLRHGNDCTYIIFGDHGMTQIKNYIDIWKILKENENSIKLGKDYLVFLDSTTARFKWITSKGKNFKNQLQKNNELKNKGFWLTKSKAKSLSIPLGGSYGDDFWCANNGTLIFPDFFHGLNQKNKGMHGYVKNIRSSNSFAMIFGAGIKNYHEIKRKTYLYDLTPTFSEILNIEVPSSSIGKSLLE